MSNLVAKALMLGKELGYRALRVQGHDTFGFLITPNDNVLAVNEGTFGGLTFVFEYIPSVNHGSGCSCNDDAIYEINAEALKRLETSGEEFAKEIGAKRYRNSQAWLEKCYWNGRGLMEM